MIFNMYITMLSVIISGILNMIFCKTKLYKNLNHPIDNYLILKDGNRLFGNNKTWIGFLSMCIINSIVQVLCGFMCYFLNIENRNEFYLLNENTFLFNLIIGFLLGLLYMLFELPNSFIKRRLNIPSGKTILGIKGLFFFVIDQIDSMFGVILILYVISDISILKYFGYIILGGFTHILVNIILYKMKVRKNL